MDESRYNVSDEEMDSLVEALDHMLNEGEPDFYGDLKEAAWNVLHENPGYGFDEWVQTLMEEYPAEVVDALGCNPEEVYAALTDLWESAYLDTTTGIEQKYSEWALSFSNECAVDIYHYLIDACTEVKRIGRELPLT